MCKQIIKTRYEEERLCKRREFKDGWCDIHHPEMVAERTKFREDGERRRRLTVEVGSLLRRRYPDIFKQLSEELENKRV